MGKLIQCSSKIAKNPYYFKLTDTNVYSIEEICYYIRQNIYLMQKSLFDQDFAVWLRDELEMPETAGKMEKMLAGENDIKDIIVTLCCSCDYYDEKEINNIIKIIDDTRNLPTRKKQKIKADNYLRCGCYEKAVEEYERVLKSDDMLQASIQEYGSIYHNMGVVYAYLGDLVRAAEAFSQAYEKNKNPESLKQYIFALLLDGRYVKYDTVSQQFGIPQEECEKIKEEFDRIYEEAESVKEVGKIAKLKDVLKAGYVDEYYEKVNGYIKQWKDAYRDEISI